MILSLALSLAIAQAAGEAPLPPLVKPDGEIVVTAARVRGVLLKLGRDASGKLTCDPVQSSGSPAIDEWLCGQAAQCAVQGARTLPAVQSCIDRQRNRLVRQLNRMRKREARDG